MWQLADVVDNRRWTVGQVCDHFGVTSRALRFYEERGLISPPRQGRDRHYTAEEFSRIEKIVELKAFGFCLTEIGAILRAPAVPGLEYPLTVEQVSNQISFLREQLVATKTAIDALVSLEAKIFLATTQKTNADQRGHRR